MLLYCLQDGKEKYDIASIMTLEKLKGPETLEVFRKYGLGESANGLFLNPEGMENWYSKVNLTTVRKISLDPKRNPLL